MMRNYDTSTVARPSACSDSRILTVYFVISLIQHEYEWKRGGDRRESREEERRRRVADRREGSRREEGGGRPAAGARGISQAAHESNNTACRWKKMKRKYVSLKTVSN